jgi:tetrahydromethanopterin S-methyltransferase subunit G
MQMIHEIVGFMKYKKINNHLGRLRKKRENSKSEIEKETLQLIPQKCKRSLGIL